MSNWLTRYHPVGWACFFSASLISKVDFLTMKSLPVRTTSILGAMTDVGVEGCGWERHRLRFQNEKWQWGEGRVQRRDAKAVLYILLRHPLPSRK